MLYQDGIHNQDIVVILLSVVVLMTTIDPYCLEYSKFASQMDENGVSIIFIK